MSEFSRILEEWYSINGRSELPWRGITDPYRIWISEIILQQTQVIQGYSYYERFIERFPDVDTLAAAQEDEVLKQWQGLGYYSRARNLHDTARAIASKGSFPADYHEILRLKGIGPYTAAAICSFAYHQPYPVIDGNVYRLLSRIFGIDTPIDTNGGKKEFSILAEELLDKKKPHIYNSAIMDFGALQCTPKNPDCSSCPFVETCIACKNGLIQQLPVKSKKPKVTDRYFVYLYITDGRHLLLKRRAGGDIWQGLYEPYLIEFQTSPSDSEIMQAIASITEDSGTVSLIAKKLKHQLTHRRLWIDCYLVHLDTLPDPKGYISIPLDSRPAYATSRIVATLFSLIDRYSANAEI